MDRNRQQIWFVLAKLQIGGIERNSLKLIQQCLRWGIDVRIILFERKGELLEEVPSQVPITCLGHPFKFAFPYRLAKQIRSQKPACIVSAFDDVNIMVIAAKALAKSDTPVLLSNHNSFSVAKSESKGLERAKYFLLKYALPWAFKHAKSIVAVSNGMTDDLSRSLNIPAHLINVIYNPIIDTAFSYRAQLPSVHSVSKQTILFVGRLVPQKNVPNLLNACAIIKKRQTVDLIIAGDGPLRSQIEDQVTKMGLADSVRTVGTVINPLPLMAASGVLVLPSKFEGLGNALVEALACGTQVVSTDCPHGPAEILKNGKYGQLVPVDDPEALANAIERALSRKFRVEPNILRQRAAEFSVEKATRRYLESAGYDISTLPSPEQADPQTHPAGD